MAIFPVSPDTDITALIASDAVVPGDVLLLEDGTYHQSVDVRKNFIRIIAKGNDVVFDGRELLSSAFVLNNVFGVEIYGLYIIQYNLDGIELINGSGHRILNNKLLNIGNDGIRLQNTQRNLLWQNEVQGAGNDGMNITIGSLNNRIIENLAHQCYYAGFTVAPASVTDNVLIGNISKNNRIGFEILGSNTLLFNNISCNNQEDGVTSAIGELPAGIDIVLIDNEIIGNNRNGILADGSNWFIGGNIIKTSTESGLEASLDFSTVKNNKIVLNQDNGIHLAAETNDNFIFHNDLICNTPENILDEGTNNQFLKNNCQECRDRCRRNPEK